jgi:hypothetical protein
VHPLATELDTTELALRVPNFAMEPLFLGIGLRVETVWAATSPRQ